MLSAWRTTLAPTPARSDGPCPARASFPAQGRSESRYRTIPSSCPRMVRGLVFLLRLFQALQHIVASDWHARQRPQQIPAGLGWHLSFPTFDHTGKRIARSQLGSAQLFISLQINRYGFGCHAWTIHGNEAWSSVRKTRKSARYRVPRSCSSGGHCAMSAASDAPLRIRQWVSREKEGMKNEPEREVNSRKRTQKSQRFLEDETAAHGTEFRASDFLGYLGISAFVISPPRSFQSLRQSRQAGKGIFHLIPLPGAAQRRNRGKPRRGASIPPQR